MPSQTTEPPAQSSIRNGESSNFPVFPQTASVATSALMPHWKFCKQLDKAMIRASHRDRKGKAIAEVLAMIYDASPPLAPRRPRPVHETDEWLWESHTEFCAAMDRYAEHSMEIKRENQRPSAAPMHGAPALQGTIGIREGLLCIRTSRFP